MDEIIEGQVIVPKEIVLNVEFPKQFSIAYSDINALNAFIVREGRKLDWSPCSIPNALGIIALENGVSFDGDAQGILGCLYDYFRIKTREKEAAESLKKDEK